MRVALSILVVLSVLACVSLALTQAQEQQSSTQQVGLSEGGVVKTQQSSDKTQSKSSGKKSKEYYFYRKWVVKMIFCTLKGNEARNKFTRVQMERRRRSITKNRLKRQRWYIRTQLKDVQERGSKRAAQEARDKDNANRQAQDSANTKGQEAKLKAEMQTLQQQINQNPATAPANRQKLDQSRLNSDALAQKSRDQAKSEGDFKRLAAANQKAEKQLKQRQVTLSKQLEQAGEALTKAKEQKRASRKNMKAKAQQERIALRKRKDQVRQLLVSDAAAKKDLKDEGDQKSALRQQLQKELQKQFASDKAVHKSKSQMVADKIRIENKGADQKVKLEAAAARLDKKLLGLRKRFEAMLGGVDSKSTVGVERAWKREVRLQKKRRAKVNRKFGPTRAKLAAAQNAFRAARVRQQQLRMETEKARDLVHRKRSEFSSSSTADRPRLNGQYSAALTRLRALESKTRDARRAAMKLWLRFRKLKLKAAMLRRSINFHRRVAIRTGKCNDKIERNRKNFINTEKDVPADIVNAGKEQTAAARTAQDKTEGSTSSSETESSSSSSSQTESSSSSSSSSSQSQQQNKQEGGSSSSSSSSSSGSITGEGVQVAKDRFNIDLANWRRQAKKDEDLTHSKDVDWQFDELDARDFEGKEEEELQETAHKKLIINRIYDINDKNLDQDAERDASVFNAAVHDAWFKKRAEALKAQKARQDAWEKKQQQKKAQQQKAPAQAAVKAPAAPQARTNPVPAANKVEQKTRFFEMQRAEHDLKATREYATRALQKHCAGGKCGNLQSAVDKVLQTRF